MIRTAAAVVATVSLAAGAVATASSAQAAPPKEYKNCAQLQKTYPHGVGKPGAQDQGGSVTNFYRSTAVYNLNTKSDRDKDGIACEKK